MTDWIPPGYLVIAKKDMSDSLRAIAERWNLPDRFVLAVYVTSGRRSLIEAEQIISHYESKL